jgi:hypothetical protein
LSKRHDRRGIVCAGLYASGSTWTFNVAASLLHPKRDGHVVRLYVDELDEVTRHKIERADDFILKTHCPGHTLKMLCLTEPVFLITTIRDPRDAVVSLISRFKRDFATALEEVAQSANRVMCLHERCKTLTLKYEDGFVGEAGVNAIATWLGISPLAAEVRSITRRLSAGAVASRIDELVARGVLTGQNPAIEWEDETQWHPNHIGDGRVGKYRDALTERQIDEIAYRTDPFCLTFGYPGCRIGSLVPPQISDRGPHGCVDHFTGPDLLGGWAMTGGGKRAVVVLRRNDVTIARAMANRFRPDLPGDGCFGFQLRIPVPPDGGNRFNDTMIAIEGDNAELNRLDMALSMQSAQNDAVAQEGPPCGAA